MGTQFVEDQWLETCSCGKCGIVWAMPSTFLNARRCDGNTFYCPSGHARVFRETTEDRLKKDLERQRQITEAEQARAARLEQERNQVARAHTRMRRRVFNGVCPCCNRTFQNLMAHMKTEHAGDLSLANVRRAFGMSQAAVAKESGVLTSYVSLYERGKPVPEPARQALNWWLEIQAPAKSTEAAPFIGGSLSLGRVTDSPKATPKATPLTLS